MHLDSMNFFDVVVRLLTLFYPLCPLFVLLKHYLFCAKSLKNGLITLLPTCGLVCFNVAYPWFELYHFTHFRLTPLDTRYLPHCFPF